MEEAKQIQYPLGEELERKFILELIPEEEKQFVK